MRDALRLILSIALALTLNAQESVKSSGNLKASACGPAVHHSTKRVRDPSPLEMNPPKDEALVYVVRPTVFGSWDQSKLSIDRQWIGVNQYKTYFVVAIAPGTHDLCSQMENASRLTVTLEAGKTYYFQQHIYAGAWKAQNELSQLTEAEGQYALKKCQRMIFWEK
jgi:hypothetical protein